ncbi:MAG TPA: IclR family transcriptional regulator [Cellulomonas sp.]
MTEPGSEPDAEAGTVRSPLQTVDRALEVLLSYSERRTDWGVSELAERHGWDKSTAQRLLAALAARGFLRADPVTRRYALGPAMWRMAAMWERTGGLALLAEPVLARLAQDTDRTALLAVPDGAHLRCIAAVDGGHGPIRSHPLVGDLYPAHAGATSRAYFAFLPAAERRRLLSGRPVARYSELTPVDEAALDRDFEETARLGHARSDGEYDRSTRAVAVPVLLGRRPVGSLSLVAAKSACTLDELADDLPRLHEASAELSTVLASTAAPRRRGDRPRT